MKHRVHLTLLLTAGILLFFGCKKDIKPTGIPASTLVQEAHRFFIDSIQSLSPVLDNYRAGQLRTLHWEQATKIPLSLGTGVLVPVTYPHPLLVRTNFGGNHFYNLDNLCHVLLHQLPDKSWKAEVVISLPDSGFLVAQSGQFTGIKIVEDWQGNPIAKYRMDKGGIRKFKATNKRATTFHIDEICYEIAGYNYPSADPADGYYWVEDAGCDLFYYGDDPGGGGMIGGDYSYPPAGGGGGSGAEENDNTVVVLPGKNVITNVAEYFKCFTNTQGSTYSVTIYVDQPAPGSRTPWVFRDDQKKGGDYVNAGHTFLVMTEISGSTTITRNVGFYPSSRTFPGGPSVQGQLNNDDLHGYTVGGAFSVTSAQFYNILNYVTLGNQQGFLYNLSSNNCTTFAINALAQGTINLPSTIGIWPAGMGNDPGDLGEDLRIASIPGMTLITNISQAHFNMGQCQ